MMGVTAVARAARYSRDSRAFPALPASISSGAVYSGAASCIQRGCFGEYAHDECRSSSSRLAVLPVGRRCGVSQHGQRHAFSRTRIVSVTNAYDRTYLDLHVVPAGLGHVSHDNPPARGQLRRSSVYICLCRHM